MKDLRRHHECKNLVCGFHLLLSPCCRAECDPSANHGQTDAVTAISNLENDGVKADLLATQTFTRKFWLMIGPAAIAMGPITQKPIC